MALTVGARLGMSGGAVAYASGEPVALTGVAHVVGVRPKFKVVQPNAGLGVTPVPDEHPGRDWSVRLLPDPSVGS